MSLGFLTTWQSQDMDPLPDTRLPLEQAFQERMLLLIQSLGEVSLIQSLGEASIFPYSAGGQSQNQARFKGKGKAFFPSSGRVKEFVNKLAPLRDPSCSLHWYTALASP